MKLVDAIGHITVGKQDLFYLDARSSRSFATLFWTLQCTSQDEDTDEETLVNLVCGAVGEGVGVKFMATMKNSGKLQSTDVPNGKVKKLDKSVEIAGNHLQFRL